MDKLTTHPEPSKEELLNGLMNSPEYDRLQERQWRAIDLMWGVHPDGTKWSMIEIAKEVGVDPCTISRWRARTDFIAAHQNYGTLVLMEAAGSLKDVGLKLALSGDRKLLLFFLDRIFPKTDGGGGDPVTVNTTLSWGDDEDIPMIDVKVKQ